MFEINLNQVNLNRRNFLGSAFFLFTVPTSILASEINQLEESVLRFAVISDVHFSNNPDSVERERLEKALTFLRKSQYNALVIAGDVSNHGYTSELELFRNTLMEKLPNETQALICMGNHEFYGGNDHKKAGGARPHWEKIFERTSNSHTVINGFHFIGISPDHGNGRGGDYGNSIEWLRIQLEDAAKDNPKRPIIVFQHYHVSETVYGSCGIDHWGIPDLKPLLDEYPQVIDFSGHSHYPSNDLRSVWQGNFTAFGTSTLSYFEMTGGIFEKFPKGHRDAAQMYIVDVKKDFSVQLKIYDVLTDSFFPTSYLLAQPGNVSTYKYTNQRFNDAPVPDWQGTPKVKISNIQPTSVTFTFPQAQDASQSELFIGSYQIIVKHTGTLENKDAVPSITTSNSVMSSTLDDSAKGVIGTTSERTTENTDVPETNKTPVADYIPAGSVMSSSLNPNNEYTPIDADYKLERNPWSEYYFKNQPTEMTYQFTNLIPNMNWVVEIRARNVFGKLSEKVLRETFQTCES